MQCSWTPPLIHHHPFQCRWTRLNFLVATKALRKWFPKFVPWDTSGAHTQRWTRLWVRVCLNVVGLSACVNIQRYIVLHPVRLNLVPLNKPCRPRAPPHPIWQAGETGCNGARGSSEGFEAQDAALFVEEWQSEYLMVDSCGVRLYGVRHAVVLGTHG